jgi:hypothetical protein
MRPPPNAGLYQTSRHGHNDRSQSGRPPDRIRFDLAVTTDFRDVFAELAYAQLGVDAAALFPAYSPGPSPGIVVR